MQMFSHEKVFWKYAASLQKNTRVKVWFQQSCFTILLKSHFYMYKFAAYFQKIFS